MGDEGCHEGLGDCDSCGQFNATFIGYAWLLQLALASYLALNEKQTDGRAPC